MDDVLERLQALLSQVAERCWTEPDLDDYLAWRGATLEYWVQMIFAVVVGRTTWAARGETPLITACPGARAKTNEKWADAAVIWPDGAEALAEIKTAPASRPEVFRAVVTDLAALAAVDWPATLRRPDRDRGVDERWWEDRHRITKVWPLSIVLLYEQKPMAELTAVMQRNLSAGLARLRLRFPDSPRWVTRTEQAIAEPFFQSQWSGERHAALMLAWAAPPS